jgi:hypothetical protein
VAELSDIVPDVDDVALKVRTRTVGPGVQVGRLGGDTGPGDNTTFDETTRPTAAEVSSIIDTGTATILGRLRITAPNVPTYLAGLVKEIITIYAVIWVEVSFFRETMDGPSVTAWQAMLAELMRDAVGGLQDLGATTPTFGTLPIYTDRRRTMANMDAVPGLDDDWVFEAGMTPPPFGYVAP